VIVGLASFVFIRAAAGPSGGFAGAQLAARALTAQDVASVVKRAPDHVRGKRGVAAACRSLRRGALGNPWQCTIRYPDDRQIRYRIQVRLNGSFVGSDPHGTFQGRHFAGTAQITGCCIAVP
jgi:hypothetical protein